MVFIGLNRVTSTKRVSEEKSDLEDDGSVLQAVPRQREGRSGTNDGVLGDGQLDGSGGDPLNAIPLHP